jgi:DNA-binding NtrC family response regulator
MLSIDRLSVTQSITGTQASREEMLAHSDRGYLEDLLRQNAGNVSQAAAAAGVTRQGFYKLLQKYGIVPSEFRS